MKIENIMEFNMVISSLPKEVSIDIQKRIIDHLMSGGGAEDPYIKQQLRFAENVINGKEHFSFTRETLNEMLDEIIEGYFADEYKGGLLEIAEYIKGKYLIEVTEDIKNKYKEEISALPER